MKKVTFDEILRKKLKDESHQSLGFQESQDPQDPAFLAFLLGNTPKFNFQIRGQYQRIKTKKESTSSQPQLKAPDYLNDLQKDSWAFFAQFGESLKSEYKKGDLKTAFRKIAKKIHPDILQTQESHSQFLKLQEAFQNLYCMGR